MRDGSVNYKGLLNGIKDGKLPEEKITQTIVRKVFVELEENEQYALDFRAFLILTNTIDLVWIYGLQKPGYLINTEFIQLLDNG